ncbi:MAG TPA: glycosyltransferase family 2 protein, partial [Cyclobacteriaceae bacterium]|nr:glycosyltransferase family 2 protein [Cyclobacteriaceae bacterium]
MENLVSVIMPVYNADIYVELAITSVIKQTYANWELLVVDDGSVDKSNEIIEAYANKDSRIKTFHQPNRGVSSARNLALENARGEYIAFLDADDWLPPDSLRSRIRKFTESPATTFVDGRVDVYNEAGNVLQRSWAPAFRGNPHHK